MKIPDLCDIFRCRFGEISKVDEDFRSKLLRIIKNIVIVFGAPGRDLGRPDSGEQGRADLLALPSQTSERGTQPG